MATISERLRNFASFHDESVATRTEAADTIDALVAALEEAQKANSAILMEGGLNYDKWWDSLVAAQQGIGAALALARGGK